MNRSANSQTSTVALCKTMPMRPVFFQIVLQGLNSCRDRAICQILRSNRGKYHPFEAVTRSERRGNRLHRQWRQEFVEKHYPYPQLLDPAEEPVFRRISSGKSLAFP
jgi:hypothetical protein